MVQFQNVTKKFKMYAKPSDKLKDLFLSSETGEFHHALRGISFDVEKSEIVGIIGLNGSGKSTLSNLIAGVTMPSSGEVKIEGTAALIAISSGLNAQLTGLENIELKGLMLGLTKQEIKKITPKVIEFADIGKFINQPVKTYSSGMKSRLGFAISVHIDPDILVIDEALSVGDQTFTKRCLDKMNEFKENGKTIFFISHSLSQVKSFCTKALWIHYGEVRGYGEVDGIVDEYQQFLKEYNGLSIEERNKLREDSINKQSSPIECEETCIIENNDSHAVEDMQHRPRKHKDSTRFKEARKKKLLVRLLTIVVASLVVVGSVVVYKSFTSMDNKEGEAKVTEEARATESKAVTSNTETKMAIVTTKVGIVRSDASTGSKEISRVEFGDALEVVDRKKSSDTPMSWLQVKLPNGKTGWISSTILQEYILEEQQYPNKNINSMSEFLLTLGVSEKIAKHSQYLNKSVDILEKDNKEPIISRRKQGDRSFVEYKNVEFIAENQNVSQMNINNISIPIKESASQLGEPFFVEATEGIRLFLTNEYSITVSTLYNKIVAISIKITNNTLN